MELWGRLKSCPSHIGSQEAWVRPLCGNWRKWLPHVCVQQVERAKQALWPNLKGGFDDDVLRFLEFIDFPLNGLSPLRIGLKGPDSSNER